MSIAIWILILSGGLLTLQLILIAAERQRGRRIVVSSVRGWADHQLATLLLAIRRRREVFVNRILKMSFHLTLYSIFRSSAALFRRLYHFLETKTHRSRARIARLKTHGASGRGTLGEIIEHKRSVSLSEKEKDRLKKDSLE